MKTHLSYLFIGIFMLSSTCLQAEPWKFVATGDSRGESAANEINTNIIIEIGDAIVAENPDLVVYTGDLIQGYPATEAALQLWTNAMSAVYAAGIGVYPIRGNHEVNAGGTGWTNVFAASLPDNGPAGEIDKTFFVTNKNAIFIGLDQYSLGTTAVINQVWLDNVISNNTLPHVFVYSHEPAFKSDHADCMDDSVVQRDIFWNSISNAGCRVYFAGHDHFFDVMRLDDGDGNPNNDTYQYIVGTGGAPPRSPEAYNGLNSIWAPTNIFFESNYGYTLVTIDNFDVTLEWKRREAANTFVTAHTLSYTIDADGDGMWDAWEKSYGTDYLNPDTDSDGQNDGDEVYAGEDPLNHTNSFKITDTFLNTSDFIISWRSISGKYYTVLTTTNIIDPLSWTNVGDPLYTNILSSGLPINYTNPSSPAKRYFKVRTR